MRFDERETTHPVLPELDLAVVREKKKEDTDIAPVGKSP